MKLFIHKLFHWEYWPFQIVYIPIYFLWIFYAIKSRTLFFFNACNPRIRNGGFIAESKKEIYDLIPQQFYPKTDLILENSTKEEVFSILEKSSITFPFIAKPDIGLRGSAVKKIHDLIELEDYHNKANFDYLIQDLIPYTNEVGIFYVRFPNQQKGKITGIVGKEFLEVTGDGISTITALLKSNPRYELQLKSLQKEYGNQLDQVLAKGQKRNLVPYGNHARGAKFIDVSHLISEKLTDVIDQMCQQIPEFYFGRMDLMYETWDDLANGKNFSIVELNGAGSEPTHIYDPKHSLFFAWYELARHISYMFQISVQNHQNGFPYLTFKEGVEQYQLQMQQQAKIYHF
ncbi:D-alanine--D-alanine ligase [Flavobacterium sp.]|uniref:D-alanine--D-alanine ligase n=1 Tax=Flavobacterium sp. TaxID=239 RepID=UPI0025B84BAA|nr:D-alanine--D-alanine ligase [Flavobacterium sp.]MBA4154103.1 D-alanine--D-alanine ligase [Flavobacterium sp.]